MISRPKLCSDQSAASGFGSLKNGKHYCKAAFRGVGGSVKAPAKTNWTEPPNSRGRRIGLIDDGEGPASEPGIVPRSRGLEMSRPVFAGASIAAVLLTGCATAPMDHGVQNTRVYNEPKDLIWERVVEAFATSNLSIKAIEKDSGIISAERMFTASSGQSWADCGNPGLLIATGRTADLNVFVRPAAGGTSVTVNTRFSEARRFGDNVSVAPCSSTGELERSLLDRFGRQISIASAPRHESHLDAAVAQPAGSASPLPAGQPSVPPRAPCGMVPKANGVLKMVPCPPAT